MSNPKSKIDSRFNEPLGVVSTPDCLNIVVTNVYVIIKTYVEILKLKTFLGLCFLRFCHWWFDLKIKSIFLLKPI